MTSRPYLQNWNFWSLFRIWSIYANEAKYSKQWLPHNQDIISCSFSKNEKSFIQPLSTFVIQHDFSTDPRVLCHIFFLVFGMGSTNFPYFRVHTVRFSSHKQWVEIFQVLTADKIRFPLLLVSCFISLFRPKDLTFPIILNVFDRKLLLKNSSKNFNGQFIQKLMRYIENLTLFVSHYYINSGSMIVQVIENHYDRKCFSYLIRLRTRQCGYKSGKT